MNKQQLIHVISAACRQLECQELYLLGSQAAYGSLDKVPAVVITSNEADLIPKQNPERAIEISGGMGEFTRFHDEFDYYAHGIELSEVTLPEDWQENLVDISFYDDLIGKNLTVYCLALYDLCARKLAAGRPKDFEFVKYILKEQHISYEEIKESIDKIPENLKKQRTRAKANLKLVSNLKECSAEKAVPNYEGKIQITRSPVHKKTRKGMKI